MLVVSRKVGERILIGDQITVTVIKVGSGGVRIGIQAPKELAVVREELAQQVRHSEQLKIDEQLRLDRSQQSVAGQEAFILDLHDSEDLPVLDR